MFDQKERNIRRVLRLLSRQRIGLILQPGNVWVIEYAVTTQKDKEALITCYLRGWAEPVENAIPSGDMPPGGVCESNQPMFTKIESIFRLTDSGWNVVNKLLMWTIVAVFSSIIIGLLGIIIGLFGLISAKF